MRDRSILFGAIIERDWSVLNGWVINRRSRETGKTLLEELVEDKDIERIKLLLSISHHRNIGLNCRDGEGYSLLYHVCNSTIEVFSLFMRCPYLNVNMSVRKMTAKASFLLDPTWRILIENDSHSNYNTSPLSFLIKNGMTEKAKMMLENKNTNLRGEIYYACEMQDIGIIRGMMMMRGDVDIKQTRHDGVTIFMSLCANGKMESIREMLRWRRLKDLLGPKPDHMDDSDYDFYWQKTIDVLSSLPMEAFMMKEDLKLIHEPW